MLSLKEKHPLGYIENTRHEDVTKYLPESRASFRHKWAQHFLFYQNESLSQETIPLKSRKTCFVHQVEEIKPKTVQVCIWSLTKLNTENKVSNSILKITKQTQTEVYFKQPWEYYIDEVLQDMPVISMKDYNVICGYRMPTTPVPCENI